MSFAFNIYGGFMQPSAPKGLSLFEEYLSLYKQEDEVNECVARIYESEGNERARAVLRNELAPSRILTPLGDFLRNINPEVFVSLFGKDFSFIDVKEKTMQGEKNETQLPEDFSAYSFDKKFILDVKKAVKELKTHPKLTNIEEKDSLQLTYKDVKIVVARIWTEKHKTSDGAMSVLQASYDTLQWALGADAAKETRVFTLIGGKMSDMVEESLDPCKKEAEESRKLRQSLCVLVAGTVSMVGVGVLCIGLQTIL